MRVHLCTFVFVVCFWNSEKHVLFYFALVFCLCFTLCVLLFVWKFERFIKKYTKHKKREKNRDNQNNTTPDSEQLAASIPHFQFYWQIYEYLGIERIAQNDRLLQMAEFQFVRVLIFDFTQVIFPNLSDIERNNISYHQFIQSQTKEFKPFMLFYQFSGMNILYYL